MAASICTIDYIRTWIIVHIRSIPLNKPSDTSLDSPPHITPLKEFRLYLHGAFEAQEQPVAGSTRGSGGRM